MNLRERISRILSLKMTFIFLLGWVFAFLSMLVLPVSFISNVKQTLLKRVNLTSERALFSSSIDTSRYSFQLIDNSTLSGTYQLAEGDTKVIFAVDRFNGQLYSFEYNGGIYEKNYLGNAFEALNIGQAPINAKSGQKIDNAGNRVDKTSAIAPTVFDIEFAFGKLYMSVTLPGINNCTFLKLISFDPAKVSNNSSISKKVIFESPCITDKDNPTMWAGRISHSNDSIFLSVGEQRYDPSGFPKNDSLSKLEIANPISVFGKVLQFSPRADDFEIFSSGHRNAQGLYFSKDTSKLFESEHGPFGGDEVNILDRGRDYGWPFRTYGKPYPLFETGDSSDEIRSVNPASGIDKKLALFGAKSGTHQGFFPPLMSWIPGVGAANIYQVQSSTPFTDWHGNILVAHMKEGSLHRLVLNGDSAVLDERINLGVRVRDFILTQSGFLVISTDDGHSSKGDLLFYEYSGLFDK